MNPVLLNCVMFPFLAKRDLTYVLDSLSKQTSRSGTPYYVVNLNIFGGVSDVSLLQQEITYELHDHFGLCDVMLRETRGGIFASIVMPDVESRVPHLLVYIKRLIDRDYSNQFGYFTKVRRFSFQFIMYPTADFVNWKALETTIRNYSGVLSCNYVFQQNQILFNVALKSPRIMILEGGSCGN